MTILSKDTNVVLKLNLGELGIHRITLKQLWNEEKNVPSFHMLVSLIRDFTQVHPSGKVSSPGALGHSNDNSWNHIKYTDEDGDVIMISSDEELVDAFEQFVTKEPPVLRATVTMKDSNPTDLVPAIPKGCPSVFIHGRHTCASEAHFSKLISVSHTIMDGFISCIDQLLSVKETAFILSEFEAVAKTHVSDNNKMLNEKGTNVSKRTLRDGYNDLANTFKEDNHQNMALFHTEMLKVDAYKSKKSVPVDHDLKKYMDVQPNYRPGEITGYYIEPSVFKALAKHQLDMLRFLECALLSKHHAREMLRMVKALGSKLNLELIIKINSASHNVTKQLADKLRMTAKNEYKLQAGFYLGYYQAKYKALLRLTTSAFTFQLLKGIHIYYSDMHIKDFESVLAEEITTYWNTPNPMSPLEILMTNYIVYFTDFTKHYSPFDFDSNHNLITKLYFGRVANESDFKWEDYMTIEKPTEFTNDMCQTTYNSLTKDTKIKVPLSFAEYLTELKLSSNDPEKTAFLLHPQKTIYHAFLGILEPAHIQKSKRAPELETNKGKSVKKKKTDKNEELKNSVKLLTTFFAQHEKGQPDAFETFFDTAHSLQMFPAIMKQLITPELKSPTKTEVQQTLFELLKKWNEKLSAELNTESNNSVAALERGSKRPRTWS